jgi:arabinose-5-phosphate isomerase
VTPLTGFSDLMREMSEKGLGISAVVDDTGLVLGVFTDGDLRRLIEKGVDARALLAHEVMNAHPVTIEAKALATQAAQLMEQKRITSLLVVDQQQRLCGALNSNDLMRAKVI